MCSCTAGGTRGRRHPADERIGVTACRCGRPASAAPQCGSAVLPGAHRSPLPTRRAPARLAAGRPRPRACGPSAAYAVPAGSAAFVVLAAFGDFEGSGDLAAFASFDSFADFGGFADFGDFDGFADFGGLADFDGFTDGDGFADFDGPPAPLSSSARSQNSSTPSCPPAASARRPDAWSEPAPPPRSGRGRAPPGPDRPDRAPRRTVPPAAGATPASYRVRVRPQGVLPDRGGRPPSVRDRGRGRTGRGPRPRPSPPRRAPPTRRPRRVPPSMASRRSAARRPGASRPACGFARHGRGFPRRAPGRTPRGPRPPAPPCRGPVRRRPAPRCPGSPEPRPDPALRVSCLVPLRARHGGRHRVRPALRGHLLGQSPQPPVRGRPHRTRPFAQHPRRRGPVQPDDHAQEDRLGLVGRQPRDAFECPAGLQRLQDRSRGVRLPG